MLNQIIHGDCLEEMKHIPDNSIDMILCDLPYGTTACKWDVIIPFDRLWEQYKRIVKPNAAIVLTASQPFTSQLVMSNPKWFRYEWIWNKLNQSNPFCLPLKIHENILVFYLNKPTFNAQKVLRTDKELRRGHRDRVYNFTGKKITRKMGFNNVYGYGDNYDYLMKSPTSIINFSIGNGHTKKRVFTQPKSLLHCLNT